MINFYKYHRDRLNKYDEYGRALSLCSYYWFCYGEIDDHTSILHIIKKVPKYACYYARFIIEDRWLGAEQFIIKDRDAAHDYARYVLKCRWPEAEHMFIESPSYVYQYSLYVIGDRWLEAEDNIKYDEYWWNGYCKQFNIPT